MRTKIIKSHGRYVVVDRFNERSVIDDVSDIINNPRYVDGWYDIENEYETMFLDMEANEVTIDPDPVDSSWYAVAYKGNTFYVTDDAADAIDEAWLLNIKVSNRKKTHE